MGKKLSEKPYKALRLKIMDVYDTQAAFAEAMGWSKGALSQRLSGKVAWKMADVSLACDKLHIPETQAHVYFFN